MPKKLKTYRIETERLVIRCYQPSDAELLRKSTEESKTHLLRFMDWAKAEPQTLIENEELIQKFRGNFDLGIDHVYGIFNKAETELIGGTGLHPRVGANAREIGYWINVNYCNKGLATECTSALTKIGFEIENLNRIQINCEPENSFSAAIPKKLGYTNEAILKQRLKRSNGEFKDVMIFSMFKEDYEKSAVKNLKLKAFDFGGNEIKI